MSEHKFTLKATDDAKEFCVVLLDGKEIDAIRTATGGFLKRLIVKEFDGEEVFFESRKCTDKGIPMADVWIPQVPNKTIQELADLVSLGVRTEAEIVGFEKVGEAIAAQHASKEGIGGKFTRAVEKAYTNKLTGEQWVKVAEADDKAGQITAFAKLHWLDSISTNRPVQADDEEPVVVTDPDKNPTID